MSQSPFDGYGLERPICSRWFYKEKCRNPHLMDTVWKELMRILQLHSPCRNPHLMDTVWKAFTKRRCSQKLKQSQSPFDGYGLESLRFNLIGDDFFKRRNPHLMDTVWKVKKQITELDNEISRNPHLMDTVWKARKVKK